MLGRRFPGPPAGLVLHQIILIDSEIAPIYTKKFQAELGVKIYKSNELYLQRIRSGGCGREEIRNERI